MWSCPHCGLVQVINQILDFQQCKNCYLEYDTKALVECGLTK